MAAENFPQPLYKIPETEIITNAPDRAGTRIPRIEATPQRLKRDIQEQRRTDSVRSDVFKRIVSSYVCNIWSRS